MANEDVLARINAVMHLRRPQEEALNNFYEVVKSIEGNLSEIQQTELNDLFKSQYPTWKYDTAVEFTYHLATGVGKTRLIGATMAYLYLTGLSNNFAIISPRAEVVRKFYDVCQVGSKDYLFVDRDLVPAPQICDASTNLSFMELFEGSYDGPNVWILTPQAFTANEAKIKKRNAYSDKSIVEHLKSTEDLVVFFDESHHLGYDSDESSIWRNELYNLNPRMIIGTTASVDDFERTNVIYSYDLVKCLNEKKYTKLVKIIPDKRDDAIGDEDYDHMILRFAIDRLNYKQQAIENYESLSGDKRDTKAVMLVCCQDIPHAEQTAGWLKQYLHDNDAVLLVHSELRESEYVDRLTSIEDNKNPAKIVVSVTKLNEGWDVSNIYVIAPLRAMASITMVTQVMGRGLRLPYGVQVENEDVDTLDVLCFGKETMQEVCDKLTQQGYGISGGGIKVEEAPDNKNTPQKPFTPKKKIKLQVAMEPSKIAVPVFALNRPSLDIDSVSIPPLKEEALHSFFISDPRTIKRLNGNTSMPRTDFLKIVTTQILKKSSSYLSASKHYMKVYDLVDRFLISCAMTGDKVTLEPERVVGHIKRSLDSLSRQVKAEYFPLEENREIELADYEVNVPEDFDAPISVETFNTNTWVTSVHRGLLFSGWIRSLYKAVPFDQVNELKIAKILDRSDEVTWWFRNLPGLLTMPTPAGNYSPDFAIFFDINDTRVLLEIKGDIYFGNEDADATIKANAAKEWCKAQSEASHRLWQYWFLLDSDADICDSFDDIRDNAEIYE